VFALGGRQDGGNEIGEAFANAGAGLGYEMMPGGDRAGDGIGHFELLRAMLVVGQPRGDAALRAKNVSGR
jgi:hypothetical protein